MALNDKNTRNLLNVIRDSFRVRKNQDPLYVDLANNLERIEAPQHQVIFGRRGSGKSCLLVHHLNRAMKSGVLPVYILADEYKKLTYPDVLIRLLINIAEDLQRAQPWYQRWFNRRTPLIESIKSLRKLLNSPITAVVKTDETRKDNDKIGAKLGKGDASVNASSGQESSSGRTSSFKEEKLEILERHLHDHKGALEFALEKTGCSRASLLLDDFYLLPRSWHPDVIDYLHRLLRDTNLYLKIATIRHRTTLSRNHPQTIGVELFQDVEELNLDQTLDDVDSTQAYLAQMIDTMGIECDLPNVTQTHFNPDGLRAITLASGGVPRDYLNIFVHSVEVAIAEKSLRWLTPRCIWKGAGRLTYQTKLKNLREDADESTPGLERVFVDLLRYCLVEKRKTAFLVSQEEAQDSPGNHEIIQQLMDMKLIHVIEPDTSAAQGRPGRYEAYTLDFSLFMEPRRRNIRVVEFWIRGEDRHKKGIREAPVYPLSRVGAALRVAESASPEEVLEEMEAEAAKTVVDSEQQELFPTD